MREKNIQNIFDKIGNLFVTTYHDNVEIKKRGGSEKMYFLEQLKLESSNEHDVRRAHPDILRKCNLPVIDFEKMERSTFIQLKSLLPEELLYHDLAHTANVAKAAIRLANLEGLSSYETLLLCTAVYFHDSGFLVQYSTNEKFGIKLAQNKLGKYGYTKLEIDIISKIIAATALDVEPVTLLEKIMCDADHDYLGRADYTNVAKKLRIEMQTISRTFTDIEWIDFQLNFLENQHRYHTETAQNIRESGKKIRIQKLKMDKDELINV